MTPRWCANSTARQTSTNRASSVRRGHFASSCAGDHVGERRAGQPLHREVRRALVAAEVVHRHDARVLEPALDLRLAEEPRDRIGIAAPPPRISLIAMSRSTRTSCASHTSPIPPLPSSVRMA